MEDSNPQTPKNLTVPLEPDTTAIIRQTSQTSYQSGDLKSGRAAVLTDLARILEVPSGSLIKLINQSCSMDVLQTKRQIIHKMDNAVLTNVCDRRQWAAFPVPPSMSGVKESETFLPFGDIFRAVSDNVAGCGLSFATRPNIAPHSDRNNSSRPDAYLIRSRNRAVTSDDHWFDIAVPFEFKKEKGSKENMDNLQKIIWSLHNIMREDVCRRFAFGITIEDYELRLWLSNRAFLAMSQPIDFIQNIDQTVYLLTSLVCASVASEMEGLGWDPTVRRIKNNSAGWQYKFVVKGETFTTRSPLATYGADSLVGRGTRVFEAVDSRGNVVAIKDSWRESNRPQEGEILKKIMDSCASRLTAEEVEEAKKAFVQIKLYDDVYISGKLDTTGDPCNETDLIVWKKIEMQTKSSRCLHRSNIGNVPDSGCPAVAFPTQLGHVRREDAVVPCRVHTRTVFSDVGVPLQDIVNLRSYLSCLNDAFKALRLLHKAGWVHRDFSTGNVVYVQDRGRLGDFEYAKEVNSTSASHDVRTGTLNFMSVEVEAQDYLFRPPPNPRLVVTRPPFRMNFLHDIESVWWAFAWVLFYYTDEKSEDMTLAKEQHDYLQLLFPGHIGTAKRRDFLASDHLCPASHTLYQTYRSVLDDLRMFAADLTDGYREAESSYPKVDVTCDILKKLYPQALHHLGQAIEKVASDVKLCPIKVKSHPKRPRSDGLVTLSVKKKKSLIS